MDKDTIGGWAVAGVVLLVIFGPLLFGNSDSENYEYEEDTSSSWQEDTYSDEPQSYYEEDYETDYVDSDYVDDRGIDRCTEDCGGHSAGYEWADENGVCDEDFSGGNSDSFAEGVQEYAYENC